MRIGQRGGRAAPSAPFVDPLVVVPAQRRQRDADMARARTVRAYAAAKGLTA